MPTGIRRTLLRFWLSLAMRSVNTRPLTAIVNKQKIEPADLKRLRREVFPRGLFSVHAADTLAHIQETCEIMAADWPEYYLTAMVKFILQENKPKGTVTHDQAHYLFQRLSNDGIVETSLHYELLLRILDQATDCPDEFVLFVLDQIRLSLMGESDLLRKDASPLDGALQKSDVDLMKRILFPVAPGAKRQLTRAQVEFLMDLNDMTERFNNHRSWTDLYVKAVSGFVLDSSKEGARDQQHRASWHGRSGLASKLHLLRDPKALDPKFSGENEGALNGASSAGQDGEGNFADPDPITWFIGRLKEKAQLTPNERALLGRLKNQSAKLHSELGAFLTACNGSPDGTPES